NYPTQQADLLQASQVLRQPATPSLCPPGWGLFRTLWWPGRDPQSPIYDAVISGHPVRQDVINARRLNLPRSAAEEQEGAALPEEVGADAIGHGNRLARLVFPASRIARVASPIQEVVASRAQQPLV